LFIFHFVLPILPANGKHCTLYKSRNLNDKKPKTKLPKHVMSRAFDTLKPISKPPETCPIVLGTGPKQFELAQNSFRPIDGQGKFEGKK
jgi:hypothetical protein